MGDGVSAAAWGLLGTVVGALASVGTTWITNAHASKLESQKTKDARAEVFRVFQRQTLLDLQESLVALASKVTDVYRRELALGETGVGHWEAARLIEETAAIMAGCRQAMKYAARVADEPLRLAAITYLDALTDFMAEEDHETAAVLGDAVRTRYAYLTSDLGVCLRSHYEQP